MKRPAFAVLALLVTAALTTGCFVEPDPGPRPVDAVIVTPAPTPSAPVVQPATVQVATGQTLSADAGQGAGVFVEYHGNGQWYVWATCDTNVTQSSCSFQLSLTPESGATLSSPVLDPADAAQNDSLTLGSNQLSVSFLTTTERDGVQLQISPPGAALQLEAWLDNDHDARIIYWAGPDAVHTGAPTDPVLLAPTAP